MIESLFPNVSDFDPPNASMTQLGTRMIERPREARSSVSPQSGSAVSPEDAPPAPNSNKVADSLTALDAIKAETPTLDNDDAEWEQALASPAFAKLIAQARTRIAEAPIDWKRTVAMLEMLAKLYAGKAEHNAGKGFTYMNLPDDLSARQAEVAVLCSALAVRLPELLAAKADVVNERRCAEVKRLEGERDTMQREIIERTNVGLDLHERAAKAESSVKRLTEELDKAKSYGAMAGVLQDATDRADAAESRLASLRSQVEALATFTPVDGDEYTGATMREADYGFYVRHEAVLDLLRPDGAERAK